VPGDLQGATERRRRLATVAGRTAAAVGLAATAVAVTELFIGPLEGPFFFSTFPAVAASALIGGAAYGVLTAVLCGLAFALLFFEPIGALAVANPVELYRIVGIVLSAILVAVTSGALRAAWARARRARDAAVRAREQLRAAAGRLLAMQRSEREARLRAEAAEREARAGAELQEQLLGVLGHDLRNPLSSIRMSAAAIARRGDLPDPVVSATARIARSAERMTGMISDLLDVTRARRGLGVALERTAVRLDEVCRRAAEELQQVHPGRAIEVAVGGAAVVHGDPSRLGQVVSNLLSNALQHGAPGSAVRLEITGSAGEVSVSVHNAGTPIPEESLPHVFEPFRRAGEQGGLGLGLFIVREIVRAHGGSIEVRSDARDGTTFRAVLPRAAEGLAALVGGAPADDQPAA
jgi:signal transduction histidine kinase